MGLKFCVGDYAVPKFKHENDSAGTYISECFASDSSLVYIRVRVPLAGGRIKSKFIPANEETKEQAINDARTYLATAMSNSPDKEEGTADEEDDDAVDESGTDPGDA